MSNAPKLCKDCAHFISDDKCSLAPKPLDYVHGNETGFYKAQAERETVTGCGPTGKWWEAA